MVRGWVDRVRGRIETHLDRHQIYLPWWVPLFCFTGELVCVLGALLARDALWPVQALTLALLLVLISPVVHVGFQSWLPWWLDSLGPVVAATWLMFHPDGVVDLAPSLLALVTAEIAARDGLRPGAIVGSISAALIVLAQLNNGVTGYGVHLLEVLLGFVVGAMLLWQMRALAAERVAREGAWAQATTAERERIAREIHDLVAHSLSVSLLQVTGARRALRDVVGASGPAEAADAVAEVDAALADAEQVGRRAMADIRRTVSAMAEGPSERNSLPGACDIAALVGEMSAAGLRVEYDEQGDPAALTAASGLGLYRIAQESLANVAKHGSGMARMSFVVTQGGGATLRVSNPLPPGRPRADDLGSGLAGMQARASQLGATLQAGAANGQWEVVVRLGPEGRPRRDALVEFPCGKTIGKVRPT